MMAFLRSATASLFAMGLALSMPQVGFAQERLLTAYVADIGIEDHYNSSGARLTSFAALIAQDRANYHRFGVRHANDQSDAVFGDRAMRAQIGPGLIDMSEYLGQYVRNVLACQVNCGTYMYIEVFGTGRTITRIRIQVPG